VAVAGAGGLAAAGALADLAAADPAAEGLVAVGDIKQDYKLRT